jgi:hypothetical protein
VNYRKLNQSKYFFIKDTLEILQSENIRAIVIVW